MRNPQELREIILELLDKKGQNPHQMLKKCGYNTSLVNDMKKGQMPSADKLANIAKFLGVSSDELLGAELSEGLTREKEPDIILLENLRREFYGSPESKFTPEDMQIILDTVKMLVKIKSK